MEECGAGGRGSAEGGCTVSMWVSWRVEVGEGGIYQILPSAEKVTEVICFDG